MSMLVRKEIHLEFTRGVWGGGASSPEAEEIFKKIKQNGGFIFFFCFLARLPISPKL